jgi:hypothetical protein
VPGFPLPVLVRFGLCRSSLFLAAILVALSPHPKIPFLADKAQRADTRFCPTEAARWDFSAISRDFLQPPFGLCRQIKSLRSLSAPLSPAAKIPFLRRTWRPRDVVAVGRNERDAVYPPVFAIADGFCCGLSGIEAEDWSLASLRQIFLTLPAAGAQRGVLGGEIADTRRPGPPPVEAGRGYGTRAMIFS